MIRAPFPPPPCDPRHVLTDVDLTRHDFDERSRSWQSLAGMERDSPLLKLKRRRLTMNTMTCEDGIHELTIDDLDKVAGGDNRPQHLTLSSLQDDFITMMAAAKAAGEYK